MRFKTENHNIQKGQTYFTVFSENFFEATTVQYGHVTRASSSDRFDSNLKKQHDSEKNSLDYMISPFIQGYLMTCI